MESVIELFHRYGLGIAFVWVLLEALGLPFPSLPLLLAVGAMAATGEMTLLGPFLVVILATMIGDIVWYFIGRKKGRPVLHLMCRLSMNQDACILQSENIFARYGAASLLIAKFIPGLSTVAPPVAGHIGMSQRRFFLYDLGGAVIWAGSLLGLGYLLRREVHRLWSSLNSANHMMGLVILVAVAALLAYKLFNQLRRREEQAIPKTDGEALWRRLERGEQVVILDVRDRLQVGPETLKIKDAVHVPASEVESFLRELPRDKPIVVYCA